MFNEIISQKELANQNLGWELISVFLHISLEAGFHQCLQVEQTAVVYFPQILSVGNKQNFAKVNMYQILEMDPLLVI